MTSPPWRRCLNYPSRRGSGQPLSVRPHALEPVRINLSGVCCVIGGGSPVAAHIHRGRPSQNGPIVVTFAPLPGSGDPGASGGCVPPDGGNTAVLEEILKHPNHFYACTRAPSPAGLSAASSSTGARSAAGAVGSTGRGPPARRPAEEFDSVMRETPWLLRKARWASPLFVRAARAGAQGTPPGRG
jgi:hypothetical protein